MNEMVASQALRLNFWILAIPKFQYLHSYIKFSHLRLIYSRTSLLRSRYLRPKYMVMWNSPKDKSFFANHTFLQSTFFPVFMSCIHGPKKKSGKCILGGFSSATYIFSPARCSLSECNAGLARTPWGAHAMETCCAIHAQSGHPLGF